MTTVASREPAPEERAPRVLRWIVQVGFTLAFAVVALLFGLWFGVELLNTQREGIEAINQIRDYEMVQSRQLQQIDQRLERIERAVGTTP